jgi:ABC-type taurine transport system substrate-binding protein
LVEDRSQTWARLLAKIYEVDPIVCPKCGTDMKVVVVIQASIYVKLYRLTDYRKNAKQTVDFRIFSSGPAMLRKFLLTEIIGISIIRNYRISYH